MVYYEMTRYIVNQIEGKYTSGYRGSYFDDH